MGKASTKLPYKSREPLIKLVYQFACISSILARVPLWLLRFALFRRLRPHPGWTAYQCTMARVARAVVSMQSNIGLSDSNMLRGPEVAGAHSVSEEEDCVVIEPFAAGFYRGPLVSKGISPTEIRGTWYPKGIKEDGEADVSDVIVVLHIHGGGFVTGDGGPHYSGSLARTLVSHAKVSHVLCPSYRLAGRAGHGPDSNKENYNATQPFPAALQDVLTSYLYLVRMLRIPERRIVLSGDSAGGNLAIGLLRYLSEFRDAVDGVGTPGCVTLLSPWVAPLNYVGPDIVATSNPHYASDFLPANFGRWGARAYYHCLYYEDESEAAGFTATTTAGGGGGGGNNETDYLAYVSPWGHPFATNVPIFVNLGGAEMLEIEGTQWVAEMRRFTGGECGDSSSSNRIVVNYEPGAPHDTMLVGRLLGWQRSAEGVASKLGQFVSSNIS